MTSICICIYTYTVYFICTENKTKTQPGLEISFQTKLRECFSDFLVLTKFLKLEETVDWLKLLKFGMNTKIGESTIFKVFCKARTMEK